MHLASKMAMTVLLQPGPVRPRRLDSWDVAHAAVAFDDGAQSVAQPRQQRLQLRVGLDGLIADGSADRDSGDFVGDATQIAAHGRARRTERLGHCGQVAAALAPATLSLAEARCR